MGSCPSLCDAKESHDGTNSYMNHPSSSVQAEEDMDCGSDRDSLGMHSSTENSPVRKVHSSRKVDAANNARTKSDDDIHSFTPSDVQEEKKEDSHPQEKLRVSSARDQLASETRRRWSSIFPPFSRSPANDVDPSKDYIRIYS
jgi:hypothetical protein